MVFFYAAAFSQQAENIIIITTDGFRWQEIFRGMDSAVANDNRFNQDDSANLFKKYWDKDPNERRKKIMPFLWNVIGTQGQIYGNRDFNNKVDNANPFWFSYPGYSELFTGYVDTAINRNSYPPNPNMNFLEFLNKEPEYKNKVAAFASWYAFDSILNEKRAGLPVYSAFDKSGAAHPTDIEKTINGLMEDSYKPFGREECLDVFTHFAAMNYLKTRKPRILYISYGETDEWAHSGHYRDYLDAAFMVDKWVGEIWNYVQTEPQYKNKTSIFFTTDHGRGDSLKVQWKDHSQKIPGASQVWFAAMGPGIEARGEQKTARQYYLSQLAQTISNLIGKHFKTSHPVGERIDLNN